MAQVLDSFLWRCGFPRLSCVYDPDVGCSRVRDMRLTGVLSRCLCDLSAAVGSSPEIVARLGLGNRHPVCSDLAGPDGTNIVGPTYVDAVEQRFSHFVGRGL